MHRYVARERPEKAPTGVALHSRAIGVGDEDAERREAGVSRLWYGGGGAPGPDAPDLVVVLGGHPARAGHAVAAAPDCRDGAAAVLALTGH